MENTAIITYVDDNFQTNLVDDFLPTLFKEGKYTGVVIVIDYGMTKEYHNKAVNLGATVFKFKPDQAIEQTRNKELSMIIDTLPEDITHVMTIDGGDVWFQRPIDCIWKAVDHSIGFVEEAESCDTGVMKIWSEQIGNPEVTTLLKGTNLKGSGMIAGPRKQMISFLRTLDREITLSQKEFFGLDQVMFNYVIMKTCGEENYTSLPNTFDYVLIVHNRHEGFILEEKKVYDINKQLVHIVHNAGGGHRLFPQGRWDL